MVEGVRCWGSREGDDVGGGGTGEGVGARGEGCCDFGEGVCSEVTIQQVSRVCHRKNQEEVMVSPKARTRRRQMPVTVWASQSPTTVKKYAPNPDRTRIIMSARVCEDRHRHTAVPRSVSIKNQKEAMVIPTARARKRQMPMTFWASQSPRTVKKYVPIPDRTKIIVSSREGVCREEGDSCDSDSGGCAAGTQMVPKNRRQAQVHSKVEMPQEARSPTDASSIFALPL